MQNNSTAKIQLVGAGPGDPELLTIKGLKAIQNADVILYDALINPKLLDHNPLANKIFVGKRRSYTKKTQEEINTLLVTHAFEGKRVVRLKGGDPMVFGRAAEELSYAALFNIETEVIPGISSYAGIAAQHQVPLTRRGVNESIWITTGHTQKGQISKDIPLAAQTEATVIVLMGMRFLSQIIKEFLKHKPANYPVAIIQNGTTKNEKVIVGTLGNILAQKKEHQIDNPATIIFGSGVTDTVTRYKNLKSKIWVS